MLKPITQPKEEDGMIVTLNNMGYMLSKPEKYNQAFIDFSSHVCGPVLDIGAAYGVTTLPALEAGAYVIASDLDERHLQILKNKVPLAALNRLELKQGRMPNQLDFDDNSLSAVLASRSLNFITPEDLEESLKKIMKWLKPGGKFFYLGGTPYMGTFRKFLPAYEKRKAANHPWPGFIEDLPLFTEPERSCDLPEYINLLDEETLTRALIKTGFFIEEMGYSPAIEEHPIDMKLDGREQLGAIALKQ